MKRSFIPILAFIAVWLIVLLVPELRWIFEVQLRGSTLQQVSALPAPADDVPFLPALAKRYPNDVRVQAMNIWRADPDKFDFKARDVALLTQQNKDKRYDALIQRFPNNAWLVALRIRNTFIWLRHNRIGGELSASSTTGPFLETSGKPNFTQAEWRRVIELCRRGQKLEPNNAYFDWMLAYFLLANYHDAEAFRVLDKGARKSRYNDHTSDDKLAAIAVYELWLGRPLLIEEKARLWSTVDNFGVFAKYRELARLITWQSIKAQRRGDNKQALLIYGGLIRMSERMRRDSYTYIEGLVAIAMGAIAQSGPGRARRYGAGALPSRRQRAADFREYTARYGGDLVPFVNKAAAAQAAYRQRLSTARTRLVYGLVTPDAVMLTLLWRAGVLLLLLMLPMIAIWAVLCVSSRRAQRASDEPTARPLAVAFGILACLGLWLLLLLCELVSSAITQWDWEGGSIWDASSADILELISSGVSGRILETRWLAAVVPLILLCAFSFARAADWQRCRWRSEKPRWQQLRETLSLKADPSSIVQRDLRPLALLIIEIAMLGLILGPWIAFAVWPNSDSAVLFVGLIGVLWVLYLVRALWIWLHLPGRRAAWRYALQTYRSVLGAFVVTASVLWLLIAVISLPLRRKADSNIELMTRVGEVRALTQFK